jgi:SAM-dependent methyltransferase
MQESIKAILRLAVPARLRPRVKAVYYGGHRYICPICDSRLRKFLPHGLKLPVLKEKEVVGGGYYPYVLCPICGSYDRMRLLYLYLLHKTDIFQKPQRILHFAPESAIESRLRRLPGVDYVSADLSSESAMMKIDLTDIRFPAHSFDVIICNHVLEHVVDDRKAMRELFRTLRPGGWAILQVPISLKLSSTYEDFTITSEADREQAFGQSDHVRLYARDYKDRLEQAGFIVTTFQWTSEPENFGAPFNTFGLNEKETVYHVTKPVAGSLS